MPIVVQVLAVSISMAGEVPSLIHGKKLFESTKLGSNGKSCSTCHNNGNGLEKAAAYDSDELADIVNRCIEGPLEGKALATGANDMKSLLIYIKSLSTNGK